MKHLAAHSVEEAASSVSDTMYISYATHMSIHTENTFPIRLQLLLWKNTWLSTRGNKINMFFSPPSISTQKINWEFGEATPWKCRVERIRTIKRFWKESSHHHAYVQNTSIMLSMLLLFQVNISCLSLFYTWHLHLNKGLSYN